MNDTRDKKQSQFGATGGEFLRMECNVYTGRYVWQGWCGRYQGRKGWNIIVATGWHSTGICHLHTPANMPVSHHARSGMIWWGILVNNNWHKLKIEGLLLHPGIAMHSSSSCSSSSWPMTRPFEYHHSPSYAGRG